MEKGDSVIISLITEFTHGSRASMNPYGREAVKNALRYLAEKHNVEDYLDAVSIIMQREAENNENME